ncbi:MAG: pilus assembly protein PilP [Bdellovibrionales bacterium]
MQRHRPFHHQLKSDVKTFALYFFFGLTSLGAALFVTMVFLSPSKAQQQPTTLPAAPTAPPSLPNAPTVAPSPVNEAELLPTPSDPALAMPSAQPSASPVLPTGKAMLDSIIEDFNYEVSGRRDPFLPYTAPRPISVEEEEEQVSPLQRFDLDQLTLVGIIWDVKKPKAMFLDPQGKGYIISKLDKIGRQRGYIAEIREGEVVVLERYVGEGRSSFQTRTFRLQKE